MSVNGFNEADLRNTPASVLQTDITTVTSAITMRLAGTLPESAEAYSINGRAETRTPLEFLVMYRNALYRALAIQAAEPDGLGIALARLGDATPRKLPERRGF